MRSNHETRGKVCLYKEGVGKSAAAGWGRLVLPFASFAESTATCWTIACGLTKLHVPHAVFEVIICSQVSYYELLRTLGPLTP